MDPVVLSYEHTGLPFVDLLPQHSQKGQIYLKAIDDKRQVDLTLEGFVLRQKGSFDEDELQEIRDWIYLNEDALKAHWANPSLDELINTIRKLCP